MIRHCMVCAFGPLGECLTMHLALPIAQCALAVPVDGIPLQPCIVRRLSLSLWLTVVIQWLFCKVWQRLDARVCAGTPALLLFYGAGRPVHHRCICSCAPRCRSVVINLRQQVCWQGSAGCAVLCELISKNLHYSTVTLLLTLRLLQGTASRSSIH